jgi:hypothetical protein
LLSKRDNFTTHCGIYNKQETHIIIWKAKLGLKDFTFEDSDSLQISSFFLSKLLLFLSLGLRGGVGVMSGA